MHPLIARYLSPDAARETLQKEKDGAPLEPEERLFAQTAAAHPDKRAALTGSATRRHPSSDAEASVIFLAAYAATRALAEDAQLGPATARARQALAAEGASEDETDAFLASILMEEAFGYEQEVEAFDATYVQETLGEVPALAALVSSQPEPVPVEPMGSDAALSDESILALLNEAGRLSEAELLSLAQSIPGEDSNE